MFHYRKYSKTHCNKLIALQPTATNRAHCNTLQQTERISTFCNKLQHIAANCCPAKKKTDPIKFLRWRSSLQKNTSLGGKRQTPSNIGYSILSFKKNKTKPLMSFRWSFLQMNTSLLLEKKTAKIQLFNYFRLFFIVFFDFDKTNQQTFSMSLTRFLQMNTSLLLKKPPQKADFFDVLETEVSADEH